MKITLMQLNKLGACADQVALFEQHFGDSVVVTAKCVAAVAQVFDWDWAASHLLSATALEVFDKATAPALKAYREATAPTWKAYNEARASAEKAYREARAPVRKAYREAVATAWKAYNEAMAVAFAKAAECFEQT